jgi:FMN-dependent NADH-azoreductase
MSLYRLDASIRSEGSVSRAIADIVEQSWREGESDVEVTRRQIGLEPLPSGAWALAVSTRGLEPSEQSPQQRNAVALAAKLVDEIIDAQTLLFAVPLYNFGVSQHFKTWVDLVVTDPRMGGGAQPLKGKPAVLVTVRGGAYGPGTPREGWDHASGWYRRILEDVWGLDLRVVETEFTLVGVNPALDQFKDLAAQMRRDAEGRGAELGRHLSSASPPAASTGGA